MKKNNILTLYVLTYERPSLLDVCLNSIENQTFKDFDLVVVNNGSATDYSSVIKKIEEDHIISLIAFYRNNVSTNNLLKFDLFFASFNLIMTYFIIKKRNRSNFLQFIIKAIKKNATNIFFPFFFFTGALRLKILKYRRNIIEYF